MNRYTRSHKGKAKEIKLKQSDAIFFTFRKKLT